MTTLVRLTNNDGTVVYVNPANITWMKAGSATDTVIYLIGPEDNDRYYVRVRGEIDAVVHSIHSQL